MTPSGPTYPVSTPAQISSTMGGWTKIGGSNINSNKICNRVPLGSLKTSDNNQLINITPDTKEQCMQKILGVATLNPYDHVFGSYIEENGIMNNRCEYGISSKGDIQAHEECSARDLFGGIQKT